MKKIKDFLFSATTKLSVFFIIGLGYVPYAKADAAADKASKYGLDTVAGAAGLTTKTELPAQIGTLLNATIGTLGLIFLVLAVYAGFKIMLSQGGEGYKEGKKTLLYAVIGIVIIASSYALSSFVLTQITGK